MSSDDSHASARSSSSPSTSASEALPSLPIPLAYPVYCQPGALAHIADIVSEQARAHRYAVISDDTVAPLHARRVLTAMPAGSAQLFSIPPGEHEKTRERWAELTDALFAWGAGRDTTIIAVGGGVIGDLAGFVAATFMRGIPVVQVPTTLLAMVDASVGGKTAIDTAFGKNVVGAFHDPRAVVIDPNVLSTLPVEHRRSGLAEMIKHGVIADASYFDAVLHGLHDDRALPALIAGSVRIKAAVVSEDTRESGLRQILNFGHTIAHAVERELAYQIAHGDAVAMGMIAEARIAEALGIATPGLQISVTDAVRRAGLPTRIPSGLVTSAILAATYGDKKSRAGSVRYALPRGIGEMEAAEGRWSVAVHDDVVLDVLQHMMTT